MRILSVESDRPLITTVSVLLKGRAMMVDVVHCIPEAVDLARIYDYDLIIVSPLFERDICSDMIKTLRQVPLTVPLVVLATHNDLEEKLRCFDAGADDYLIFPFDPRELTARVDAVVRRFKGHPDSVVRIGALEINFSQKNVTVLGQKLALTAKEYALMELLALRKGGVLSKEQILNHLYGGIDEPEMKIIDVFLCKIRRKIEKLSGGQHYIHTVWGRGYVLKESDSVK